MAKQSNAVALASQPAALLPINTVQEMQFLGNMLSSSQLFGTVNPAEGLAIVAMCHQKRMSWMDFMQNFHMIKGRISKKADAIIADFHRLGGSHEVVSRTSEVADAVFTIGKTKYQSTVRWEDCLNEPFVYDGRDKDILAALNSGKKDGLVVKAKYRTPRSRMQMLWARCVSDGVRTVAPECCQGVYTPEETDDFSQQPTQCNTVISATSVSCPAPQSNDVSQLPAPVEICPAGSLAGHRWDSMQTDVLKQAINVSHPSFTTEMKDYIGRIIADREANEEAVDVEVENV